MDFVKIADGTAGTTTLVASTDTAAAISDSIIINELNLATKLIITVETNPIRYAFTSTPTQAGLGHLAAVGSGIVIDSSHMIRKLKIISATAGAHAALQVTPIF